MKKTCKDLHIQVEEGIIRPAAGKSRILYGGLRMYKLLLVSDREDVLNAFEQVQNWERQGFKPPHIRHDFEGTKDSLAKHHADGIAVSVNPEEEKKILAYLQEFFPNVPIFQAGTTRDEVLCDLNELNILLNRIHADFSNDRIREIDLLQECRHEFFRKLITGQVEKKDDLLRNMRLLRRRMDPAKPCLILPTVHTDGRILILCCALYGMESAVTGDQMTAMLTSHIADGIAHLQEFFGLDLHIAGISVLPSLYVLCKDAAENCMK